MSFSFWNIDAGGDASWSTSSYGDALRSNKSKLNAACDQVGASWDLKLLLLGMGFQETTTLSSSDRDASKDNMGDAANVSAFNLSLDLVKQAGYNGNPWDLNYEDHLPAVVTLVRDGINKWGVNSFLNFVRGGRTAFQDGYSYGAYDYRNSMKTMCEVIDKDQSLLWDDRRVNIDVQHV